LFWASKEHIKLHDSIQTNSTARTLDPAAAEVLGARLMTLLDIGTSPEIRVFKETAALSSGDWFIKRLNTNGRLKAGDNGNGVAVRRIPRALPLCYLPLFGIEIAPGDWKLEKENNFVSFVTGLKKASDSSSSFVYYAASMCNDVRKFLAIGRPEQIPNPRQVFWDFTPPGDLSNIKAAVQWNSGQMLAIHAARLFLGCTTAHAGNILIDGSARLYSIDHELCAATDGEEIRILSNNLKRGTKAHAALKRVADLPERSVYGIFEGLPLDTEWPLGSHERTALHFIRRLRLFRQNFA